MGGVFLRGGGLLVGFCEGAAEDAGAGYEDLGYDAMCLISTISSYYTSVLGVDIPFAPGVGREQGEEAKSCKMLHGIGIGCPDASSRCGLCSLLGP